MMMMLLVVHVSLYLLAFSNQVEPNDVPIWVKGLISELIGEISEIRTEMRQGFAEVKREVSEIRQEMFNRSKKMSEGFRSVHDFAVDRFKVLNITSVPLLICKAIDENK